MGEEVTVKEDLRLAYEYFSHHIRTSSSTIVATLEAVKDGLADDPEEMLDVVTESGFLLDLFDRGLCASISIASGDELPSRPEKIDVGRLSEHFFDHTRRSREGMSPVSVLFREPLVIETPGYLFKVVYQVLLWEAARSASGTLHVVGSTSGVDIAPENGFTEVPDAMPVLRRMMDLAGACITVEPKRWKVVYPC